MIEIENRKMEESIKQNADFLENFKKGDITTELTEIKWDYK